jgi:hypothetical protein
MDSGAIAYVRQNRPMGLGHAVWCARRLIGNEPFAVLLPDDVIAAETPACNRWSRPMPKPAAAWSRRWKCRRRPPATAFSTSLRTTADRQVSRAWWKSLKPEDAPSNLAVIGRYILTPKVLTNLNKIKQGAGGRNPVDRRHRRGNGKSGRSLRPALPRASAMIAARRSASCRRPSPSACRAPICAESSSRSCTSLWPCRKRRSKDCAVRPSTGARPPMRGRSA